MITQTIKKHKLPTIYKHNKLNTANFGNFTLNDYQVFLHLVSKICGINNNLEYLKSQDLLREYKLTAKEFSVVFGVSLDNCYTLLKQAIDKLMKTDIKVEKLELRETWRINICSMAKYNKKDGYITIQFTDSIMPYLTQVRARFMHYHIKEISSFRSLYTTRLYELIMEFKSTGFCVKSITSLREILAVGDNYKLYGHFKAKTINHACIEINRIYPEINLSFEEIKEGRKVVRIQFTFNKFSPLLSLYN